LSERSAPADPARTRAPHAARRNADSAAPMMSDAGRPHFAFAAASQMDILRIILAIILPPLGVFLQVGLGTHFWINVILTLLGYVPGIIHALYIILSR
jgi:uncharacterized membrane protein YqaE (UPF0057 family)